MFQFFQGGEKIGGGGRYDALIPLMGGKDTPASGFALYLDRLMNLVKPEALAESPRQRILIRAKPEAVKEGLSLAEHLREAGYIAEFNLGVQKLADFNWTLDVQSKPPKFILTDRVKRQKFEAKAANEVLAILRKADADKSRVA
jgi:histidyl-tRNA synthetase